MLGTVFGWVLLCLRRFCEFQKSDTKVLTPLRAKGSYPFLQFSTIPWKMIRPNSPSVFCNPDFNFSQGCLLISHFIYYSRIINERSYDLVLCFSSVLCSCLFLGCQPSFEVFGIRSTFNKIESTYSAVSCLVIHLVNFWSFFYFYSFQWCCWWRFCHTALLYHLYLETCLCQHHLISEVCFFISANRRTAEHLLVKD